MKVWLESGKYVELSGACVVQWGPDRGLEDRRAATDGEIEAAACAVVERLQREGKVKFTLKRISYEPRKHD